MADVFDQIHAESQAPIRLGVIGTGSDEKLTTPAAVNHNPGNLRDPKTGAFRTYDSPEEGFQALVGDIEDKQAGRTPNSKLTGESSLSDFAAAYAPKKDRNDPVRYAQNLAKHLDVTPDTPIGKIDSHALAAGVSKLEDAPNWKAIGDRVTAQPQEQKPAETPAASKPAEPRKPDIFDQIHTEQNTPPAERSGLTEGTIKPSDTFLPGANKWLQENHPKVYSAIEDLLTAIPRGAEQMARGIARPGQTPAQRTADIIEGATTGLAPTLLAVPGSGHVKQVLKGLVAAGVGQKGVEKVAQSLGMDEDTSRAAGDVAGLAAGLAVGTRSGGSAEGGPPNGGPPAPSTGKPVIPKAIRLLAKATPATAKALRVYDMLPESLWSNGQGAPIPPAIRDLMGRVDRMQAGATTQAPPYPSDAIPPAGAELPPEVANPPYIPPGAPLAGNRAAEIAQRGIRNQQPGPVAEAEPVRVDPGSQPGSGEVAIPAAPEIPDLWNRLAANFGKDSYSKLNEAQQGLVQNLASRMEGGTQATQAPTGPTAARPRSYYGLPEEPAPATTAQAAPPAVSPAQPPVAPPLAGPESIPLQGPADQPASPVGPQGQPISPAPQLPGPQGMQPPTPAQVGAMPAQAVGELPAGTVPMRPPAGEQPNSITGELPAPRKLITGQGVKQFAKDNGIPEAKAEDMLRADGYGVVERQQLNKMVHAAGAERGLDHAALSEKANNTYGSGMGKITDDNLLEMYNDLASKQAMREPLAGKAAAETTPTPGETKAPEGETKAESSAADVRQQKLTELGQVLNGEEKPVLTPAEIGKLPAKEGVAAKLQQAANRKASKPPSDPRGMTAGDLNKELDKIDKQSSQVTKDLIDAGRGNERPSDYLKLDDPLSARAKALADRRGDLRNEVERRYGPGAPSRLPKGFGPIKR